MRVLPPFENEPPIDFTVLAAHSSLSAAIDSLQNKARQELLRATPFLNGVPLPTAEEIIRQDPSTGEQLGRIALADSTSAQSAVSFLAQQRDTMSGISVSERAKWLYQLATILSRDRFEFIALTVLEVGKPWKEADADVVEAIDFCRYYAGLMEWIGDAVGMGSLPGEHSTMRYEGRGVTVVIAPWNFPLAIACGMTVASLVTGNPTILKPAEQASLIGSALAHRIIEAGCPKEVFAFLPGRGETVGKALVEHPQTATIAFTGSREVGFEILKSAAEVRPGQHHLKRVVAELGGKNCIIVDSDADLDQALKDVLTSAFGFSGQKCSACSRVLVVGHLYERFVSRLGKAAAALTIGPAAQSSTSIGPVIDREAQERILRVIADARKELTLLFGGQAPSQGSFVPPAIFTGVPFHHPLWTEEIFGPVLAVSQVQSFDHALEVANASPYALTGGVLSRNPRHLAEAKRRLGVGNLYLNRSCTGAIVGRHPFGGRGHSGIGSKAGGPDYLFQFLDTKTVTENTIRRGFTPELSE